MVSAVYNDIEPFVCAWMRNLIDAGHIARGEVIERSITEMRAEDVTRATQFHAFAGIGVWSHALRLAGWPDDVTVWTGSCPCQPFSQAGARNGFADPRHLWPAWFRLIKECRPPVVFGEQVADGDGLEWLDHVFADLEGAGYACAAADLCAASRGAPHERQRLFFVGLADAECERGRSWRTGATRRWAEVEFDRHRDAGLRLADAEVLGCERNEGVRRQARRGVEHDADRRSPARGVANGASARSQGRSGEPERSDQRAPESNGVACGVEHADGERAGRDRAAAAAQDEGQGEGSLPRRLSHSAVLPGATRGFWGGAEWVLCRDPTGGDDWRYRPVEPGSFPLAHGAPARVGRVRAYGNAIVAEVAATFIRAVMDHVKGEATS